MTAREPASITATTDAQGYTGLELLAPAKDAQTARTAILHGADAVYIGGPSHGARASASNSIDDIASLTDWAHLYGAKVYVTLNTIIYDDELSQVERDIHDLYHAGADALIVQDMSILRMDIPPIDLHASTQCDIRTADKARFLSRCGFSQIVLPRELSLAEIGDIRRAVSQETVIETFVHGALCVSYSGDCQASCIACGRSANRGECAQMCRLPYSLTDAAGNVLVRDKHLLSLRDLNRLADIQALAEAGATSFKIEGRLKDTSYVKATVAAYRAAIDKVISGNPRRYRRTSHGVSEVTFTPDVNRVFNRGFTSYYLNGRPADSVSMANIDTPKWVGQPVGRVTANKGKVIMADTTVTLNNGDGLGYFAGDGSFSGFRLNRIDGNRLFPATAVDITPGTVLYRNRDVKADALMEGDTARRLIGVELLLTLADGVLNLAVTAENGFTAAATANVNADTARTPQLDARARALGKLGGTPYRLSTMHDEVDGSVFVPASVLNDLRQRAVARLSAMIVAGHQRAARRAEDPCATVPSPILTYHDNVANRLAETFYREHGATTIERALEVQRTDRDLDGRELTVMTTRYCLRRELGACLRTRQSDKLPEPLFLRNGAATYRLDFDCQHCQMHLICRPCLKE